MMLGVLAGMVLCCAVLLMRFLLNDAYVTAEDITRHLGAQPLASIPETDLEEYQKQMKFARIRTKEVTA